MPRFDTKFQAFRRDKLHMFRNMDPDSIVCELEIDTDVLVDRLWFEIEQHIEKEYEYYEAESDEEGDCISDDDEG